MEEKEVYKRIISKDYITPADEIKMLSDRIIKVDDDYLRISRPMED